MTPIDLLEQLADVLDVPVSALQSALPVPVRYVQIDDDPAPYDWLACGEPVLVLVSVREDEVVVAEPRVVWLGHRPVLRVSSLTGTVTRHDPALSDLALLGTLIGETRQTRVQSFRRCRECDQRQPPEWMLSDKLCQGCAERHHGVVF